MIFLSVALSAAILNPVTEDTAFAAIARVDQISAETGSVGGWETLAYDFVQPSDGINPTISLAGAEVDGYGTGSRSLSGSMDEICGVNNSSKHRLGRSELSTHLKERFPDIKSIGGFACRNINSESSSNTDCNGAWRPSYSTCWSTHASGRALDVMVGGGFNSPTPEGVALGDAVVDYLLESIDGEPAHRARNMGIMQILWNDRCWDPGRFNSDRSRTSASEMRECGVLNHDNHPHLTLTNAGADGATTWYTDGPVDIEIAVSPIGTFDVTGDDTGLTVSGYAVDPDIDDPITVDILIEHGLASQNATVSAAVLWPESDDDIDNGELHGFSEFFGPLGNGMHSVCVTANNAPDTDGANMSLGCVEVDLGFVEPVGALTMTEQAGDNIRVSGWALADTANSNLTVEIFVTGAGGNQVATVVPTSVNPDDEQPKFGVRHNFDHMVPPLTPGLNAICVISTQTIDHGGSEQGAPDTGSDPAEDDADLAVVRQIGCNEVSIAHECQGYPVSVYLALGQQPGRFGDIIWGTDGPDIINGLEGNDVICGRGGHDRINGGTGHDILDGGEGFDELIGGPGDDRLLGSSGHDSLFGGEGDDYLWGGPGNDLYEGGAGNDLLQGGDEAERMHGGPGDDQITGYGGDDTLLGGPGSDYLWGGAGTDSFLGGTGEDTLDGGDEDEFMSGGADADTILGYEGNDTLDGGSGDDYLWGGLGIDEFRGGIGNDTLDGGAESEVMNGGAGNDVILGNGGRDQLNGGSGDDYLNGASGDDTFDGGAGFDVCVHGPGGRSTPPSATAQECEVTPIEG